MLRCGRRQGPSIKPGPCRPVLAEASPAEQASLGGCAFCARLSVSAMTRPTCPSTHTSTYRGIGKTARSNRSPERDALEVRDLDASGGPIDAPSSGNAPEVGELEISAMVRPGTRYARAIWRVVSEATHGSEDQRNHPGDVLTARCCEESRVNHSSGSIAIEAARHRAPEPSNRVPMCHFRSTREIVVCPRSARWGCTHGRVRRVLWDSSDDPSVTECGEPGIGLTPGSRRLF
jgi:hypothetical protein